MLISNNNTNMETEYLNLKTLKVNQGYTKVAYVQDVRESISSLNQGFFRFYLKDINGDMIVARLFGVQNFLETGKLARMLKGQAVTIKFETQEYNGSLSILLTSIDIYTETVDFSKFIGKVDNISVILNALSHIEDIDLMCRSRLTDFYNGKVGGFALFAYLVYSQVKCYNLTNLVNYALLESATNELLPLLFSYYKRLEVQPVIDPTTIITDANAILITNSLLGDTSVLSNAYLSCCGLCKPQFAESIILCNIIKNVLDSMKILGIVNNMTEGSLKQLEDGTVLKRL